MKLGKPNSILNKYTSSLSSFRELIFLIVLLTLSLELIAGVISDKLSSSIKLIIGFSVLGIAFYYFLKKIGLIRRKLSANFQGVLFLDTKSRLPVSVENYEFSEKISTYFASAFSEDKRIKREWYNSKIGAPLDDIFNISEANKIIRESVEFYILELLDCELDHLTISSIGSNKISKFDRENLKVISESNRFYDLFTKPLAERKRLIKGENFTEEEIESTYSLSTEKGYFTKQEFYFPSKSKIKREEDNELNINTPKAIIKLKPILWTSNAVLPSDFEEYYLNCDSKDIQTWQVNIYIEIKFKFLSIFSQNWWYYEWIDSFIDTINKEFEFETFVNNLNWISIHPVLKKIKKFKKKRRKK